MNAHPDAQSVHVLKVCCARVKAAFNTKCDSCQFLSISGLPRSLTLACLHGKPTANPVEDMHGDMECCESISVLSLRPRSLRLLDSVGPPWILGKLVVLSLACTYVYTVLTEARCLVFKIQHWQEGASLHYLAFLMKGYLFKADVYKTYLNLTIIGIAIMVSGSFGIDWFSEGVYWELLRTIHWVNLIKHFRYDSIC